MSWAANSVPLPRNWASIRRRVLRESDICHICGEPGSDEVDHVVPRYSGGDEETLAPIHQLCHRRKSAAEGHARRRELSLLRRRPVDRHPGLS